MNRATENKTFKLLFLVSHKNNFLSDMSSSIMNDWNGDDNDDDDDDNNHHDHDGHHREEEEMEEDTMNIDDAGNTTSLLFRALAHVQARDVQRLNSKQLSFLSERLDKLQSIVKNEMEERIVISQKVKNNNDDDHDHDHMNEKMTTSKNILGMTATVSDGTTATTSTESDDISTFIGEKQLQSSKSTSLSSPPSESESSSSKLVLFAQTIYYICQSKYLTIQEMGRLLLLGIIPKSLSGDYIGTREDIFHMLCQIQWKNSSQIPKSFFNYKTTTTSTATTIVTTGANANGTTTATATTTTTNLISTKKKTKVGLGTTACKEEEEKGKKKVVPIGGYEWFFRKRIINERSLLHKQKQPTEEDGAGEEENDDDTAQHKRRKNKFHPLRESKLSSCIKKNDSLILLISIRNSKQEEVVSITLRDESLTKFFTNGELNVSLCDDRKDQSIPIGTFPIDDDGIINFNVFCDDFMHWYATIHLLRSDTNKYDDDIVGNGKDNLPTDCAHLHSTNDCSWGEYDYYVDPNLNPMDEPVTIQPLNLGWDDENDSMQMNDKLPMNKKRKDVSYVEVDMGYLEFTGPLLQFNFIGQALEERIRQFELEEQRRRYQSTRIEDGRGGGGGGGDFVGDVFRGIKIEPTLLCFTKEFDRHTSSTAAATTTTSPSVELVFSELRLDIWKVYQSGVGVLFHSTKEGEKHGVTLLHLLEHLADWDYQRY